MAIFKFLFLSGKKEKKTKQRGKRRNFLVVEENFQCRSGLLEEILLVTG
jgi:hypothetical protein